MKIIFPVAAALTLGLAGAAHAVSPVTAGSPPSGGASAKGNAPLKPGHTINDGAAKPGANSFTEKQARTHIMHAGYTSVSPLTKGPDGVWRGTATTKAGAPVNVGLDFKGNVSEGGPAGPSSTITSTKGPSPMSDASAAGATPLATTATSTKTTTSIGTKTSTGTMGVHHPRRHPKSRCAQPGPNGVACSGVDRNGNGVSDKEDHAIHAGARP